jgi:hypothetical protein
VWNEDGDDNTFNCVGYVISGPTLFFELASYTIVTSPSREIPIMSGDLVASVARVLTRNPVSTRATTGIPLFESKRARRDADSILMWREQPFRRGLPAIAACVQSPADRRTLFLFGVSGDAPLCCHREETFYFTDEHE